MAKIGYVDLANMIRESCNIAVTEKNKDKYVLSRGELMSIASHILYLKTKVNDAYDNKALIKQIVEETLEQIHSERIK